jgi:hypothetical protein
MNVDPLEKFGDMKLKRKRSPTELNSHGSPIRSFSVSVPLPWEKKQLQVTPQPHTGCKKFVERFGLEAMKFVNSPLGQQLHLRGINAKVVCAGVIQVGDVARKMSAT